jgi:hypothetical protein
MTKKWSIVLLISVIIGANALYSDKCFVRNHEYCGLKSHVDCKFDIPPPSLPPSSSSFGEGGLRLIQAFAVFRHGDRTFWDNRTCWFDQPQLENCKNEDLNSTSESSDADEHELCQIGELTIRGFKQHVRNGKMLRRTYGNSILPREFGDQIYVRSTNLQRTITSAEAVLFGMFSKSSAWIHSGYRKDIFVEEGADGLINNFARYDHISEWMNLSLQEDNLKKYPQVYQGIQKISAMMNSTIALFDIPTRIFDCVNTNYCHKRETRVSDQTFELINQVSPLVWSVILNYPDRRSMGKLTAGPLLSAIRNEMTKAIASPDIVSNYKRFYLILGHDTGPMLTFLNAFGISNGRWPPYASRFIFEVYEQKHEFNSSKQYVRLLYNEEEQHIPGCSNALCPWEEFQQVLADLTLPDQEFKFF